MSRRSNLQHSFPERPLLYVFNLHFKWVDHKHNYADDIRLQCKPCNGRPTYYPKQAERDEPAIENDCDRVSLLNYVLEQSRYPEPF